jgi:hypothetical protein
LLRRRGLLFRQIDISRTRARSFRPKLEVPRYAIELSHLRERRALIPLLSNENQLLSGVHINFTAALASNSSSMPIHHHTTTMPWINSFIIIITSYPPIPSCPYSSLVQLHPHLLYHSSSPSLSSSSSSSSPNSTPYSAHTSHRSPFALLLTYFVNLKTPLSLKLIAKLFHAAG